MHFLTSPLVATALSLPLAYGANAAIVSFNFGDIDLNAGAGSFAEGVEIPDLEPF